MQSSETLPRYRRFHTWIWFVAGGVGSTIVVNLVPNSVPPTTASDFFLAASGVNVTILVAISVTISSIVRQLSDRSIPGRMALFVAQLSVVFIGMIASGLGILIFNPAVPLDPGTFRILTGLILVTWILGFMLLVIGVEPSVFPRTDAR